MQQTTDIENSPAASSLGIEHYKNAAANADQKARARLVFASFNIRYAVGSFLISGSLLRRIGITRPARRAELIRAHLRTAAACLSDGGLMPGADVVALQEADRATVRAGGVHVARELAELLKMNQAHVSTILPRTVKQQVKQWYLDFEEHIGPGDPGDTGLALLARLPLTDIARIDLPWRKCPWRPRLALTVSVPFGTGSLKIFTTHIDTHASTDDQLAQHLKILELADNHIGPTVLSGDFNTLTASGRKAMRALLEAHGFETPFKQYTATWRAGLYTQHADWIFVRDAKILRHGVARPLGVSDHWPIWVELGV